MQTYIWVDGACRDNGRHWKSMAGIGVYYGPDHPRNLAAALCKVDDCDRNPPTNQRAELCALREALYDVLGDIVDGVHRGPVTVHTDLNYVVQCVNAWRHQWQKNGWVTAEGEPVANRDLIEQVLRMVDRCNEYMLPKRWQLVVSKVKAHLGNKGNAAADRLANCGADEMEKMYNR